MEWNVRCIFSQPFLRRMLLKEGSIVGVAVISSLSSMLAMVIPVLTGNFIDCIRESHMAIASLAILLLAMFSSLCVELSSRWYSARKSVRFKLCLQNALVREFAKINPCRMGEFMTGELTAKFIRDAEAIAVIVRDIMPMASMAAVGLVCAFFIAFLRSVSIGVVMVVLAIVCSMVLLRFTRGIVAANRGNRASMDDCMSTLVEMIVNFPGLKAMSAIVPALSKIGTSFERANSAGWVLDKENLKFESTAKSIMFIGEALVLSVAGLMAVKGVLTLGDVIVFQMLFAQTLGSVTSAFRLMPLLGYVNEATSSLGELVNFDGKEDDCAKNKVDLMKGRVELQNVSFAYKGSGRPVLEGVSFTLHEKECCALVGANGCGKTTLAKLVGGFSEPRSGSVLFDGVDERELDRGSLRKKISFLFQDPILFAGTLRENVTLGQDYSESDLREVFDVCGLNDLIGLHTEGFDYRITTGNGLSGGERQRVAAARALIRKPSILVLDEPSNHVDSCGFSDLKKMIEYMKGRSSILLITHDERLVALADRVVSLKENERKENERAR